MRVMPETRIYFDRDDAADITEDIHALNARLAPIGGGASVECALRYAVVTAIFGLRGEESGRAAVTDFLTGIFCRLYKRRYLTKRLRMFRLKPATLEILVRTLIAFDRERDEEYVKSRLVLSRVMSAEGYYTFRLRGLDERWNEIARLTEENAALIYDDGALNLLLKFLLSAVAPRFECVRINETSGGYILRCEGEADRLIAPPELVPALIDIAPMEVVLENGITDGALISRISNIFDIRS